MLNHTRLAMKLPESGYQIHKQFFSVKICDEIINLIEDEDYCVRDIVNKNNNIKNVLLHSPLFDFFKGYKIIRSVLFQKPSDKNWLVPWHQDQFIQVQEKIECLNFGPWSVKEDVVHVRPPLEIMQSIVSVRIHLSSCDVDDGPLKVAPSTHTRGYHDFLGKEEMNPQTILCEKGDALIFSPLLFHSSSKNKSSSKRAILHLELSKENLPHNLQWASTVP